MSKHLQRDLDSLQQAIMGMAASVEEAVGKANQALQERDVTRAHDVLECELLIDQDENRIQEECLKLLALHQPVATDLRRIVVALKIITDLERMGDLAEEIAERAMLLTKMPPVPVPHQLSQMTELTTNMVRQSLDSFVDIDTDLARSVLRLEDDVDRYNQDIIAELIQIMQQAPLMVTPGLSMFSAVRHLERIADHATNIAEEVIYLAEGEIVRHRPRRK
ncbi:MAG: phosphate signaling complex protein PhoU [Gemmataceae bacterium]